MTAVQGDREGKDRGLRQCEQRVLLNKTAAGGDTSDTDKRELLGKFIRYFPRVRALTASSRLAQEHIFLFNDQVSSSKLYSHLSVFENINSFEEHVLSDTPSALPFERWSMSPRQKKVML